MKSFEDLTITDDYMFCTVMQDEALCKTLLSLVLKDKIGKIEKIIHQASVNSHAGARGIRLDLMVQDDTGKIYDIEMQSTNQKNLPKRMRYYQCAMDSSFLNKGQDYNDLPDTFIIFFCTFDYLNKNQPLYSIKSMCTEQPGCILEDGVNKIIVNSKAACHAKGELKAFLEYMNGRKASTSFTEEIEKQVSRTREDEQCRREYMLITSFEMDARRTGIQEGLKQGIRQGVKQGYYEQLGKTIANMRQEHFDNTTIARVTGLSVEELKNF